MEAVVAVVVVDVAEEVVVVVVVVVVEVVDTVVVVNGRLWTVTLISALISGSSLLVTVTVQTPSETP